MRWLLKAEIAAHFGVSTRTITRWMYLPVDPMPFVKPWDGAHARFDVSACDGWYAGRGTTTEAIERDVQAPCAPRDEPGNNVMYSPHTSGDMSKWTRTITAEQERAVYVAVLDGGMSASAAAREAAAGNLPGAGPFTISPSTASRYVRAEKERRTREHQLVPEQWDDTYAALEREIRGWLLDGVAEIREGRDPRVNLDHARAAGRLLKELRIPGHARTPRIPTPEPGQEHQDPQDTPQGAEEGNELLQRLLNAAADTRDDTGQEAASSARASSAVTHARTREEGPAAC